MALPSNLTFAEMYERFLVEPLFRPFAEQLLERTRPTASDSVLDVACGTGIVARLARLKLGLAAKVVGIDVSGRMTDGPFFARMNAMAVIGMSPKVKALDESGRAELAGEIATASLDVLKRYTRDGVLTFALATNVVTARV